MIREEYMEFIPSETEERQNAVYIMFDFKSKLYDIDLVDIDGKTVESIKGLTLKRALVVASDKLDPNILYL